MCRLKKNHNVDRISTLPEPILQLIMSFLPFKQLVQMCVVSKIWQQAWRSFPDLEIDEVKFPSSNKWKRILNSRCYWENFLQIRQRDGVPIRKLTVKIYGGEAALNFANKCICYAIESNVEELEVDHVQRPGTWNSLPPMVLSSKSIKVLKLRTYKLESLGNDDVKLLSLRKLHLSDVYADDQVMNNLFAQCPLLQHLGFVRYNNLVNISSCRNLKHLDLCQVSYTDEWLNSQISGLPLLEWLYISACNSIEIIKISSLRLKKLIINTCERLVEVKIDTPNLRIFVYTGDLVSFSSGALTLPETDLCFFSPFDVYDYQWFVKYCEHLARFHKLSKVLILEAYKSKIVRVIGEFRLILPHPLSGAKHLNFTAGIGEPKIPVAIFMDFLLWISPHVETVCLDFPYRMKFYLKFTYKQQPVYEGGTAQCCKSLPVSCWEHCVKKVEIKVITKYNERNVALEYIHRSSKSECFIFEGQNILEKIDGLASNSVWVF